jgi:hypothetical protein
MPRCEARRFPQPGDCCKLLEEIVFCTKANHASGQSASSPISLQNMRYTISAWKGYRARREALALKNSNLFPQIQICSHRRSLIGPKVFFSVAQPIKEMHRQTIRF